MIIVAISGLIYNTTIAVFYDPESLGVFNQVYAYYIVFSQVSVWGIHNSVLKHTSEFHKEQNTKNKIFTSALVLCIIISLTVSILLYIVLKILQTFIMSNVITALFFIIPGLIFFSLNKVVINYINGMSYMKMYAICFAIRPLIIVVSVTIMALFKIEGLFLSLAFTICEIVLFIVLFLIISVKKMAKWAFDKNWLVKHFYFGRDIFLGNMVVEFNTRIDVIMLGVFLSDSIVGIYSFALVFAEGFYQIFIVVRRNINPKITQLFIKDKEGLLKFLKSIKKRILWISFCLCVLIVLCYYIYCAILGNAEYLDAFIPLIILCASIAVNSMSVVTGSFMSQIGQPLKETYLNGITVLANVLGNIILIPFFGMIGAASATGLSYFIFTIVLSQYKKKHLKINN